MFERGVEFPKNLHLMREVETKKKFSAIFESENPLCDQCDEEATATMFCKSCCEVMCSECTKCHQRLRKTKAHDLVAIKSTQSDQLKRAIASHLASSPAPCPDHPEEVLKLYCVKCSQAACLVCMLPFCGHMHFSPRELRIGEGCRQVISCIDLVNAANLTYFEKSLKIKTEHKPMMNMDSCGSIS